MSTPVWEESFAVLLTRLRTDAGLTQERLADRAGLSVRAISSLECGARRPRRYTVERLAQALEMSAARRAVFVATAEGDRRRRSGAPALSTVGASAGPLTGRAAEVEALRAHLAGVGPPVLAFTGEPGMGSSRLLAEAIALGVGWGMPVLAAAARRGDEGYAPLVDAFADHLRRMPAVARSRVRAATAGLGQLLPELAEQAREPSAPVAPVEPARRRGFDAAARFVDVVAGAGRVVLVLDDVQWAGGEAVELMAHLVRRGGPRVRVVLAYRTAEAGPESRLAQCLAELGRLGLARLCVLRPLPARDAQALVDATAGNSPLGAARRRQVLRRAAGVPLFLVELTRAAVRDETEELPWHLRLVVGRELAALPQPVFALLQRMALIATTVAVERLIADDMPTDQLLEYLGVALRFGILDETRRGFRFRYPLVREMLSAGIGPGMRRLWLGGKVGGHGGGGNGPDQAGKIFDL